MPVHPPGQGCDDLPYPHTRSATSTTRRSLAIWSAAVTGLPPTELAKLTRLEGLSLEGTQVSDLTPLAKLTSLEWLDLDNTQISDAGLVHLKDLTKLEYLDLSGTQITDAGLVHLKGLTKLT